VPIEEFLNHNACVVTASEGWAKPTEVVRVDEPSGAIEDLLSLGIFPGLDEVATAMAGRPVKMAHSGATLPRYAVGQMPKLSVNRSDLLDNEEFLKSRASAPNAAAWFRELYRWLQKNPRWGSGRKPPLQRYHDQSIVLSADGNLRKGGEVHIVELDDSDPISHNLTKTLSQSKPLVHPEVLAEMAPDEREKLRGFLIGMVGVQLLDGQRAAETELLPKILTSAPRPAADELLELTRYCQRAITRPPDLGGKKVEIWVITDDGQVERSSEVVLSSHYHPTKDWQKHIQGLVTGVRFLGQQYLMGPSDPEKLRAWKTFFEWSGVLDAPRNGVELFAEGYAVKCLTGRFGPLRTVSSLDLGYDLQTEDGSTYIEVKGKSTGKENEPVELTPNESNAARAHRDRYFLCVVSGVPDAPQLFLVQNPALHSENPVVLAPKTWQSFSFC